MPVFNSARFLPAALASIAAQTLPPLEIILVDGPSTDETPAIIRVFPNTIYLRQTGKNMWNALNEGIAIARGEYLSFLSDDDLWMPDKLRLQAEWLHAHPETMVVFAHARFELIAGESIPASFKPELLQGSFPGQMTEVLMTRRTPFDQIGMFPEQHHISGDLDWFTRLFDANISTHMLPDVLLTKRVHANNLSGADSSGIIYNRELLSILRTTVLRKRQSRQTP